MDTYPFDLQRILLGDQSILFVVEIVFRTTILYFYTLLLVRFIGKRGVANLTHFELVIVIALGSAVGDPMFYGDVPLLHGIAVVTVIVIFHRLLTALTNRHDRLEKFVEGKPEYLVREGQLDLEGMSQARLSREEVFMELRHKGVQHLGQVKWAIMEVDGNVSIYKYAPDQVHPGLSVVPPWSMEPRQFFPAGMSVPESGFYACNNCGLVMEHSRNETLMECGNCPNKEWMMASEG